MKCAEVRYRGPAIIYVYSVVVSTIHTFLITCCGKVSLQKYGTVCFLYLYSHDLRCATDAVNGLKDELLSFSRGSACY